MHWIEEDRNGPAETQCSLTGSGFTYCGSDLNHKDVSQFLFWVAWGLKDVFCSVERPLGTADGEGWLEGTAECGFVPWKCVSGARSFGIVLKQCSTAVPSEKIQCFFRWCDGEWMGRRRGFILSCGQQKAGGDRREAMGLVGVGEKKAEDWAQPVKLHWASLWLTSHWFRFCLIKQNFPRVEQMQALKHCSVSAPETWTECVPSFLPPEITHSHKTCKVFPSPPEDAPVPF